MIFLLEKISNELEEKLKNWRNLSASEKGKVIKEFCTTANKNGHDLSSISKYISTEKLVDLVNNNAEKILRGEEL